MTASCGCSLNLFNIAFCPPTLSTSQSVSAESFDDREYEELLSKYSDGGAYSSHARAAENQRHVENVKEKINSMKKKFQVSNVHYFCTFLNLNDVRELK